jgi:mono/diheme cytochrome c family protein
MIAVTAVVVVLLCGRSLLSRVARGMAAHYGDQGAISASQAWLDWAARIDPRNSETDLMRAKCYRRLEQIERWSTALQSAQGKSLPAERLQQEMRLGLIQTGQTVASGNEQLAALIDAGVSPPDVAEAFVLGHLCRDDYGQAQATLDAWQADYPKSPQVTYLRGVYWRKMGERDRALEQFRAVLARQPRHELAGVAIAELLEEQDRLAEALALCIDLTRLLPASETVKIRLARLLRGVGRVVQARRILELLVHEAGCSSEVAREQAAIDFELGQFATAARRLEEVDLGRIDDEGTLAAGAMVHFFAGDVMGAERWFLRGRDVRNRETHLYDLRVRLALDPEDREAAAEAQRLASSTPAASNQPEGNSLDPHKAVESSTSDEALYAEHCAACHGLGGDGRGRASRHLFPRPRDFRNEPFRIVSTHNGVPTLDDLELVIRLGLPGTGMPGFERLPESQRRRLAAEVWRLHQEGVRDRFVALLREEAEAIDQTELAELVKRRTTPGEVLRLPQFVPSDSAVVARGKAVYFEQNCHSCHGKDGRGASDVDLFDDQRRPTPARDLVHEPFKGGHTPEAVYQRLVLGMPGSPHPASKNLTEHEIVALVHYCRSLSREPKRILTNHQRLLIAMQRRSGAMRLRAEP